MAYSCQKKVESLISGNMIRYIIGLLLISSTLAASTVLIVGGGPAGMASAIEAKYAGFDTIVVEKRPSYTRIQLLFLTEHSLALLEKWGVVVPQMELLGDEFKMGVVEIKYLEEAMQQRIQELGIQKMKGEFVGFHNKDAVILIDGLEHYQPYEFLVGADGLHSRTRKELEIPCNQMGMATAACVLLYREPVEGVFFGEEYLTDDLYVRRTEIPKATIISVQTRSPCQVCYPLKGLLTQTAYQLGWLQDAERIEQGRCTLFDPIVVSLQQAMTFSNQSRSAIIIGDAAAGGTFLQGMGANTAFKTCACSGVFFKKLQDQNPQAYDDFNRCMKEITDEHIADSKDLF